MMATWALASAHDMDWIALLVAPCAGAIRFMALSSSSGVVTFWAATTAVATAITARVQETSRRIKLSSSGWIPVFNSCSPIRRLSRKRATQRPLVGVAATHHADHPGVSRKIRLPGSSEGRGPCPLCQVMGAPDCGRQALFELRLLEHHHIIE